MKDCPVFTPLYAEIRFTWLFSASSSRARYCQLTICCEFLQTKLILKLEMTYLGISFMCMAMFTCA